MSILRRILGVSAIVALSLGALTACGSVKAGTIASKDFKEAHTVMVEECARHGYSYEFGTYLDPSTGKMKSGYRNVYKCVEYHDVEKQIPASYKFILSDGEDSSTVDVPADIFEKASVGYYYDSEAVKLEAR